MDNTKKIRLDIEPKEKDIIKINFFDYKPEEDKKYLVIGNPPFGKVSSLAVKFFNKVRNLQIVLRLLYQEHLKELVFKIN